MANDNDNEVPHRNLDGDGLDSFPTGYQFEPVDEQLICTYLLPKLMHKQLPPNRFSDVELYKYSPWELSEIYPSQGGKCWYFFTERRRKHPKGQRPNRATYSDNGEQTGYWKAKRPEKRVLQNGNEIGVKSTLDYYVGKSQAGLSGKKQPWIMHEYVVRSKTIPVHEKTMQLDKCVLCKIYKKVAQKRKKKRKEAESEDLDQVEDQDAVNVEHGPGGAGSEGPVSSVLIDIANDKNHYFSKNDLPPFTKSSSLINNTAGTSYGYAHMGYQHTDIGTSRYFPNNGFLIKDDRPLPSAKSSSVTNNNAGSSHHYRHMGYQHANIGKSHNFPHNSLLIKEDPPLSSAKSSPLKNNNVGTSHDYTHMGYHQTNIGNDLLPMTYPSAINGQSQYFPDPNMLQYLMAGMYCDRFDNFPLGPFEHMPLTITGQDRMNTRDLHGDVYMTSDNLPQDLFFATPLQEDEVGNQLSQRPYENGNQLSQLDMKM